MEPEFNSKDSSYVAAFISCTLDPQLIIMPNTYLNKGYFITNIKITRSNKKQSNKFTQQLNLNQQFSLIIQRNPFQIPIVDILNNQHIQEEYEKIIIDEQLTHVFQNVPYFRRGQLKDNIECISNLQIFDQIMQEKQQQVTQPSISQKDPKSIHFKIQTQDFIKYIKIIKKRSIDFENIRFKPITESLFQRKKGQVDIQHISMLCFPEGIKILKKQTGFKFFNFILTNDLAERFYCKCIIFSQKCSNQIRKKLAKRYRIQAQKSIYSQKIFTLISEHNCTDQTNNCLQYLYRIYLSKPFQVFKQKINNFPNSFTINIETNRVNLSLQDINYNFKMNTSYPHTSTQAIYAIFKFLEVQNIITILENLLLERKVFFISDCQNIVGMAIQAFLSFIYPLNWVHPIISPLSSANIQYTQAPFTILFGLNNNLAHNISSEGLFVFIDKNKVQLRKNKTINLKQNLRKQIMQKLKQFSVYDFIDVRDYLLNPQNLALFKTQEAQDPNFDSYKVRNIFFELTVFILKDYIHYFKQINKIINQKGSGIKKYYNLDGILHLYRKDQFMHNFFQTSLFAILTEKKFSEPHNKWILNLDRAIKKIANSNKKNYIRQQSDISSESDEGQKKQQLIIPRSCLSLINNISSESRQSQQDKHPKSSPSPKRQQYDSSYEDQKFYSPNKNQARMSLPNEFQKRNLSPSQYKNFIKRSSTQTKKNCQKQESGQNLNISQQKQSEKQSQTFDKSESQASSVRQRQEINYQFESPQPKQKKQGISYFLCNIISYPYKKAGSVVGRWTKRKQKKIESWKSKNHKNQTFQFDMVVQTNGINSQNEQPKIKKQQNKIQ